MKKNKKNPKKFVTTLGPISLKSLVMGDKNILQGKSIEEKLLRILILNDHTIRSLLYSLAQQYISPELNGNARPQMASLQYFSNKLQKFDFIYL